MYERAVPLTAIAIGVGVSLSLRGAGLALFRPIPVFSRELGGGQSVKWHFLARVPIRYPIDKPSFPLFRGRSQPFKQS